MELYFYRTVADTARVLSRYVHAMMLRAYYHTTLQELAQYSSVPVINGLTDLLHPCQLMADILTIEEKLGNLRGKKVAWVGDGNNMANTYITVAQKMDFELRLACPKAYQPDAEILAGALNAGAKVQVMATPQDAVTGADVVVADTWVSMGDDDTLTRKQAFYGFQVNEALMKLAAPHAIFLHCLPAHRCHTVSLRENGKVVGDIMAEHIYIYGTVEGLVKARQVTLYSSARVTGSIMHENLSIEDGAFVDGKFKRTDRISDDELFAKRMAETESIFASDNDNSEPPSEAELLVLENLRLIR